MIFLTSNSVKQCPEDALNTGIYSHILMVFLMALVSLPSSGADAPVVSPSINAAPLGTLFLTPQERAALEAARLRRGLPPPIISPKALTGDIEAPPKNATITGLMKRSDGATAVWINGVIQPNFSRANAQQLTPSDVGMVKSAEVKSTPPVSTARDKTGNTATGNVTASNQTKPIKRRVPLTNKMSLPKIPSVANADLLLKPAPIKKRKKPQQNRNVR